MSRGGSGGPQAAWEALVAGAVLGTARRPPAVPEAGGALGAALAAAGAQAQGDAEGALLSAAAAAGAYIRAGALPLRASEAPGPQAPEADLPTCSDRAADHLRAILVGPRGALLPEWLALLARSGQRVPSHLIPDVLDAARRAPQLRELAGAAVGGRGRWLAAQNPDWSFIGASAAGVEPGAAAAAWETATHAERLALLAELRPRHPAEARALVEATWAAERAAERAALVAALEPGLGAEDEPFLEGALDDRSKEVRASAARLLSQIPQSRLAARMAARLEGLLRWAPPEPARLMGLRARRPGRLDVTLPESCDASMVRDGVDPKPSPNRQGLGERAQWLYQMLAALPPAHWAARWGATAAEVVEAAADHEWRNILVPAWVHGAQQHRDAEWAEALLRAAPGTSGLLAAMPPARQEALLLQLLGQLDGPLGTSPALSLLRETRHTWGAELTRAALRAMREQMAGRPSQGEYALHGALPELAQRVDPALLAECSRGWPQPLDRWQSTVDVFLITLQFRHDMAEALTARDADG